MAAGVPVIPSVGDRAYNHSKESEAYDAFMLMCELRESLWLFPRNGSRSAHAWLGVVALRRSNHVLERALYTAYSTRARAVWNPRPGAR